MTLEPKGPPELTPGTWRVDPLHTTIGFSVTHLGIARVKGRFNSFSGIIEIGDNLAASSVQVSVELSSVDTNNAQRDSHLRSTDFFRVTERGALNPDGEISAHPWMTFSSKTITNDLLSGDLTVNQISRSIELKYKFNGVAALPAGEGLRIDGYQTTRVGFSASGCVCRSDFGIDFNAPLGMNDILIGEVVEIDLEVQAVPS